MYCKRCGTQLHPQARFCKKCGSAVSLTKPVADLQPPVQSSVQPSVQEAAPQVPLTPPVTLPPLPPQPAAPPPLPPPPPRVTVVAEPDPPLSRPISQVEAEPPPSRPFLTVEPEAPPARPTVIVEPEPPPARPVAAFETESPPVVSLLEEPVTPTLITITEKLRPLPKTDESSRPTATSDQSSWSTATDDQSPWSAATTYEDSWPAATTDYSPRPVTPTTETPRPAVATAPSLAARKTFHNQTVATNPLAGARSKFGFVSGRALLFLAIGVALVVGAGIFWWMWRGEDATRSAANPEANQTAPTPPPGMVYAPGGEFMMGADAGEPQEQPAHKVVVKPFFIDRTEVTCEEYAQFIAATGHRAPIGWSGGRYPEGFAQRPVTGVDWDDANAYAAWAGKRLPTEEEWEFAARGADGRRYPWGNELKPNAANDASVALQATTNVGSYPAGASIFGAHDLAGNAWEWTASDYLPYPGGRLPQSDLPGPLKVIRGGCFVSKENQATTTFRVGWPARNWHEYDNTGFRCARDVSF